MKKFCRAKKGQFSVIAALLVSVILVTAVMSTYTMVRHAPIRDSPKVLTAIGEMNSDIKRILDFTVGYYGSILKVTGNSTYAEGLTTNYLSSGLLNIARSHPEWNPSFELISQDVATSWFMPESSSVGNLSVTYSLGALGIEGVKYETSSALKVTMLESVAGIAQVQVIRDYTEPELGLSKENFWFYNYTEDSTWDLINPTDIIITSNGVYNLTIPEGIDPEVYSLQVEDNRGILVSAFYSPDSVAFPSKIPHFTYTFDWESTGMLDIYEDLGTDNFVIEVLQNGTLKWLGQPLEITPKARPIPPVAIKAFRVNATVSGISQEVPFQVEDWASDYKVPLGLAGNNSIFRNDNMLVFMLNNAVDEITLWWDGNDTAIQTSYAWENVYFTDNVADPNNALLSNGMMTLNVVVASPGPFLPPEFSVTSTKGASATTAEFLRINGETPIYWAEPAYVISNGIVRDIVQQEPEYTDLSGTCPNFYSQVYLTLPANTPYYTYSVRTIFVDSPQPRSASDLSVVQLSSLSGTPLTEDGTSGGYPENSSSTGLFYDPYPTDWAHHWSQNIDTLTSVTLIDAESFEGSWTPTDWTATGRWNKELDQHYHGSWSADCDSGAEISYLTTPDLNTSDASKIIVDFWYRDGGCEDNEFLLQYFNGTSWNTVYDLGSTTFFNWQHYQVEITDSQYFQSDFKLQWVSDTNDGSDNVWVDLVTVSKEVFEESGPGAGIMFTDADNQRLYVFDSGSARGALDITSTSIEVNPVDDDLSAVTLPDPLDMTWSGAVVTFDEDEPIYRGSDAGGLWVMVEHPPAVTVN
jgi:hypothetical protein